MTMDGVDLGCFSYLAAARLLHVARYPAADTGAEVHTVTHSLAGDGPITALTARRLGLRVALAANHVGADPAGADLLSHLDSAGIQHRIFTRAQATAELTVVTDQAGTRTWLAYLAPAYAALADADLAALTTARLAYIDCYQVYTASAVRAIAATVAAGVPLMLNLGGDPVHPDIEHAARGHAVIVQTSLPEPQAHHAERFSADLARRLRPRVVVVTLGGLGAIARHDGGHQHAPAGNQPIVHTHGAGAAFSAGFAAAYLSGHGMPTALHQACRVGTAHCSTPGAPLTPLTLPHSPTGAPP